MKFLLLFLVPFSLMAEMPVVFKKGMIINCPITMKPIYKFVKTLREGDSVSSDRLIDLETGKKPLPDEPFKCDSVIIGWSGVCIFSNQGWRPKKCQKLIRATYSFVPIIDRPQR